MAKYIVTVELTSVRRKDISVYAQDEEAAKDKACDIVAAWEGVVDVEAVDCCND